MPRPIRTRTDAEWATMIRTQRESGLSVAKFCRQNNINQQAFYRHRNRIELKTLQEPQQGTPESSTPTCKNC